jgi:hypothetical protein
MFQEMEHLDASCVFYGKVGRFDQFKQSKLSGLTITSLGMVMLTVHYDLMVRVGFM